MLIRVRYAVCGRGAQAVHLRPTVDVARARWGAFVLSSDSYDVQRFSLPDLARPSSTLSAPTRAKVRRPTVAHIPTLHVLPCRCGGDRDDRCSFGNPGAMAVAEILAHDRAGMRDDRHRGQSVSAGPDIVLDAGPSRKVATGDFPSVRHPALVYVVQQPPVVPGGGRRSVHLRLNTAGR